MQKILIVEDEKNIRELIKFNLENAGYEVDFIPNHRASSEFPTSEEEINKYQVLILSDIGANTLLLHPDTFEKSIPTRNRLKLIKKYVKEL